MSRGLNKLDSGAGSFRSRPSLFRHSRHADAAVLIAACQEISRWRERERHHPVAVFLERLLEVADPPVMLAVGRRRNSLSSDVVMAVDSRP